MGLIPSYVSKSVSAVTAGRKMQCPGWAQLRDDPQSVRVRPSGLKRDCGRRATSTGRMCFGERTREVALDSGDLRTLRSETKGQAEACPDRRGPSPSKCRRSPCLAWDHQLGAAGQFDVRQAERRTADEYSNVGGRERLRHAATGR